MNRIKKRLLQDEKNYGRHLRKRRLYNKLLSAGGCTRKDVEDILEKDGHTKFEKMDTLGCTYKVFDENNEITYVKFLTDRQYEYYTTNKDTIEPFHAPYEMNDENKYLLMKSWGEKVLDTNDDVKNFVFQTLAILHKAGVYHGDLINRDDGRSKYFLNIGNILVKDGEYKLIDFGPEDKDDRKDEEILNMEIGLLNGMQTVPPTPAMKGTMPRYEDISDLDELALDNSDEKENKSNKNKRKENTDNNTRRRIQF